MIDLNQLYKEIGEVYKPNQKMNHVVNKYDELIEEIKKYSTKPDYSNFNSMKEFLYRWNVTGVDVDSLGKIKLTYWYTFNQLWNGLNNQPSGIIVNHSVLGYFASILRELKKQHSIDELNISINHSLIKLVRIKYNIKPSYKAYDSERLLLLNELDAKSLGKYYNIILSNELY